MYSHKYLQCKCLINNFPGHNKMAYYNELEIQK